MRAGIAAVLMLSLSVSLAFGQMIDPRQMSGIPRPEGTMPAGSVSVRLIRGDLANNIANHPIELHAGDKVTTLNTDASGRVQFDKLTPGTSVQAVAVVDGERLESEPFPVPSEGGIRLLLVATDKEKEAKAAAEAAAPASPGQVVLGGDSRIVVEPGEERIQMLYLLDISNTARGPVNPPVPFAFDLPAGTANAVILAGSSPRASVKDRRVEVEAPFAPGQTLVQVAFELPITGGTLGISQALPATLQQFALIMKKLEGVTVTSPHIARQTDMTAGDGSAYFAAIGGAVAAGQPISFTVTGLPYRSVAPLWGTLAVAALIVVVGLLRLTTKREDEESAATEERKRLITRRERLYRDLVRLENDHRDGRGDSSRYPSRREDLIASLERVYGALDTGESSPEPA